MGKIHIKLPDDLEQKLREKALKKGDLGKIVEEALKKHLGDKQE